MTGQIDSLETLFSEGLKAQYQGQLPQAEALFKQALELDPSCMEAHYQLGELYQEQGQFEQAIAHYEKVLTIDPEVQQVYNNLGVIAMLQQQTEMAIEFYFKALKINPQFALAHHNIGQLFCQQNQLEMGISHFQQAIQAEADLEQKYFHLGLNAIQQKQYRFAQPFLEAVIRYGGPLTESALLKQAFCYRQELNHEAAIYCYEQLAQQKKNDLGLLMDALYLPGLYQDEAEIETWRTRFHNKLQALAQRRNLKLHQLHELDLVCFPLAYHGENEREQMKRLGQLLRPHLPVQIQPTTPRPATKRLRVGFLSRFFSQHAVSLAYQKLVLSFPSSRWDIITFGLPGTRKDSMTEQIASRVHSWVTLPNDLSQARQSIADAHLDLLIYTDIGMAPLSYLLAFTRLAPVQAVLAGHPMTTGIPTLDYFISLDRFELPEAQEHYTETLVRLGYPNVNYPRPPSPPPITRPELGLPESSLIYSCPMSTIKMHPCFDKVLLQILETLPEAHLLLFDDSSALFNAFRQRLEKQAPPDLCARILFTPWADPIRFLQILRHSDVVLDSFPFCAGTTAYQIFSVGTPMVTYPSNYLRGRLGAGLYDILGIDDLIAQDAADYVRLAVKLGQDPAFRQGLRERIEARSHRLFEHPEGVEEMVVFLTAQVNQKRKQNPLK